MSRIRVLLLACISCVSVSPVFAADNPPHIVMILADDMGYGDLKAFNPASKISTPNLDALAQDGMVLTDAHSGGSTCKPSRYALITGQFAVRSSHFNDRSGPIIPEGTPTIASMLRDHGYQTAMVGKWHLGFDQKAELPESEKRGFAFAYDQPLTGGPKDRGFHSFFGMHASLDIPPYFYIKDRAPVMPPTNRIEDHDNVGEEENWNNIQGEFWRGGDIAPDFKLNEVTPRFADEACNVIESHGHDQPLFLYLALPSPHTPWLPMEEFVGKSGAGMYGDFVMTVDHVVGQVLSSLEKAGMSENTLVFFSSDNGPVWYDKDTERFGHRSNGQLRGVKASVWEGGHRVPFIAKWPDHIPAGSRSGHLIAFADLFATLAEVAGQKQIPTGTAIDSESFLQALIHPDQKHEQRSPILHGEKVIRDGNWKLINTKGSRGFGADNKIKYGTELYHLRKDISEENNLAESLPEKVERLRSRIQQVLEMK